MVYPGAMHTRFEHSLGVMHLITKMYDSIINKEENKKILQNLGYTDAGVERERQLVRLAGLLHDIGHAPFSHASEELFPKNSKTNKSYTHEDYTVAIITNLLKDVIEVHPINNNYKISVNEIAGLIRGDASILGHKIFWKILISSQLDADRCDYLLRDSLHIGVKYGIYDLDRLLVTLRLGINPDTEEIILGIEEGGWYAAEQLVISRYQMFTQVYYHKTRRAYDYMLIQALKETLDLYPPPPEINDFVKFDDYSVIQLMLEKSKNKEWIQNILQRKHIRMVIEKDNEISIDEEEKIRQFKEKLNNSSIWFWEDGQISEKPWYLTEEILIINEKEEVKPLSEYSEIVCNLRKVKFNKRRIYVKFEDRNKAEKLKREVYYE